MDIYTPNKFHIQLPICKSVYPSGILFLLMRCGKIELAKKLFDGWPLQVPVMKEISEFFFYFDKMNCSE